ncbi:MAG: riboflavin synthase [Bdellovibrionota bacterium]
MFTGIIEAIGTIESIEGHRISIRTPWDSKAITLGQSIAVQGCCLTVVNIQNNSLSFDISDETFSKTNFKAYQSNQTVNLERAMEMGKRFDGHMVSGHVDTIATVKKITPAVDQSSTTFEIGGLKNDLTHFIPKGSITIDGVSLTINEVTDDGFTVCIIPYTMSHTVFSKLNVNDKVNVEFDMIGKFFTRYLENYKQQLGSNHANKN